MFGQEPSLKQAEDVTGTGEECFAHLIEQITLYCQKNRVRGDALQIALRLWTFVHGAASLQIDNDYVMVAPQLDVNSLIADAAPGLLGAPSARMRKARSKAAAASKKPPAFTGRR
jgi:hypothetical protein